ncbi:MAG TPA: hypothetical protein PKN75_05110 [Bacteroidia bacterium]|nr:hypothetical protein [Bacteroidia bacterium]
MFKLKHILPIALLFGVASVNTAKAQVTEPENTDTTISTLSRYGQELELLKRIKVSGYLQAQFQYADSSGQQSFNGGNFPAGVDKRIAVRRGRVKFQYDSQLNDKGWNTSQYVLQFDVTEKGLTIKDAYLKFTDPWCGWFNFTAGMQNRPFGYEIGYSSNLRESPERGRMSQILFPGERDLGGMVTLQAPKISRWNWLKLEAGYFNGTGARGPGLDASDFDKFKDFIGHLSFAKNTANEKIRYGGGVSVYDGGFRIDTVDVFKIGKDSLGLTSFVFENKKADFYSVGIATRKAAKRKYVGADVQLSVDWIGGLTTIRGEYIQGDQPGFSSSTASPAAANTSSIYKRSFNGAYFYFLHNIMQSPWQVVVKYDWYDPNTDVEGNDIGKKVANSSARAFNATDLKYETIGLGLIYRWDANVRITAYYDMVKNETSENLSGYTKDLKDNVFTLRTQIRF